MRPSYAPQHAQLVEGDLVTWEVTYKDGSWLREAQGAKYRDIDRSQLQIFRLVAPGECLFETWPPPGADGRNLVYRRRTADTLGSRHVCFLVAWYPMGPGFFIDPTNGTYREDPRGLVPYDPDMSPPLFLPDEGEGYLAARFGSLAAPR